MFQFSVIIPIYNRQENLYLTLCALDKARVHYAAPLELIVMDDGSTDNPLEVMYEFQDRFALQYRWQPHEGFGVTKARNRGCAIARGRNYLFVDSDILLTPASLAHLRNIVNANPGVIVAGRYDWMKPMWISAHDVYSNWHQIVAGTLITKPIYGEQVGIVGTDPRVVAQPELFKPGSIQYKYASSLYSGVLLFPKDDFWALGGYDENIKGHGGSDCEMGMRAQAARCPAIFTEFVHGYHVYHERDQAANQISRNRNIRYMARKHDLDALGLYVWHVGEDYGILPKGQEPPEAVPEPSEET